MAGRIQRNFIDDLLARTDIVDVIDARVPLKKKGANYSACCPFHDEKTPSFTVSLDKQFYHCFGCGAHGSVIGFLMDYDHLDFVEAVEELALRAGVEVLREGGNVVAEPKRNLQPLIDVNEKANLFYQAQLRQHPEAKKLVSYLKDRGVSGEVAKTFQLGFAPPGWNNLFDHLTQAGESKALLTELGLVVSNDSNKTYDRFRDRLQFPIRNKRGQVIGFGGRVLDDGMPKYLNSPETPLFHKGREVYGLYEALQASNKNKRLVLVEGYMDVIALYQFGITNSVAGLGTAITAEHIDLLFRSASELVLCLDGDSAGQKAAWRSVVNALPVLRSGRQLKILALPVGEDPDSLIRKEGVDSFEKRLDEATPLSEYFFEALAQESPLTTIEGRSAFLEKAKPLLKTLPDSIFSEMMNKKLADLTNMKHVSSHQGGRRQAKPQSTGKKRPSTIRNMITLLLRNPSLATDCPIEASVLELGIPGMPVLVEILAVLKESPELSSAMLLERFRGEQHGAAINALFAEETLISNEGALVEYQGGLEQLKRQIKERQLSELLEKSKFNDLSKEEKADLRILMKS